MSSFKKSDVKGNIKCVYIYITKQNFSENPYFSFATFCVHSVHAQQMKIFGTLAHGRSIQSWSLSDTSVEIFWYNKCLILKFYLVWDIIKGGTAGKCEANFNYCTAELYLLLSNSTDFV